jgi:hypothetical protein
VWSQQVLDGNRAIERFQHQRRLSVLIALLDADFYVGEGRNVFCNGIVEREIAVLDQHHRSD